MPDENEEDTLNGSQGNDTTIGGNPNETVETSTELASDFISDDDFLKLSPEQYNARMSGANGGDPNASQTPASNEQEQTPNAADNVQQAGSEAQAENTNNQTKAASEAAINGSEQKPVEQNTQQSTGSTKKPEDKPKEDGTPKQETAGSLPAGVTQEVANEFYRKLTGPIKADGREITVRSADDAIRLIQMGYNYSRRMEELKPIKAMAQMLSNNGLQDTEKLNFLIDLSKGKKEAIQKLLADHKIDALDLDPSKAQEYKPADYKPNEKDQAFREAVEATMSAEGGRDLIVDINKDWDIESKSALRHQPMIFQNLLAQKQSGVYGKIKAELEYQRSLGYLVGVPFLQAYHQVGTAMEKAGVFNPPQPKNEVHSMAPVNQGNVNQGKQPAPIDTGTRKATAPKNPPAPNLSSIQNPRVISNRPSDPIPTDYAGLSDAEFRKLPPPR